MRIADAVTVAGFERVAVVTWAPGDDLPEGLAYFAEPQPYPDPVAGVSVPSIPLRSVDHIQPGMVQDIQTANGTRPDHCGAAVYFNPSPWSYTSRQPEARAALSAALGDGKFLILVRVRGCGV
ncbi:hypothetical protein LTV02_04460 [Nocardia yamanashiensis]|uniref:hypothetical protein n=1 Tax=Nocardia yamanashiensis TaxID=209247 RepID=UPI001E398486|nr:hypothetical protein [Nocardia yamanashiensis]UGT42677.1 hypothetical protein LTV02_04460 [Nocardia yamanashiensis]